MTTLEEFTTRTKDIHKLKYKLLKRCVKELVLENAALCDRASEMQHQILVAQEERKFLWKKCSTQGTTAVTTEDTLTKSVTGNVASNDIRNQQKKSTHKNGMSKQRQPLTRTKRKRKSEDSVNTDIAAFNSC